MPKSFGSLIGFLIAVSVIAEHAGKIIGTPATFSQNDKDVRWQLPVKKRKHFSLEEYCAPCSGTGQDSADTCYNCKGRGIEPNDINIQKRLVALWNGA